MTGDDDRRNVSANVDYEPHPEKSLKVLEEHQQIIQHITNLYCGSSSETDMQVYAEKAIYDDPYSYCDTRYKIAGKQALWVMRLAKGTVRLLAAPSVQVETKANS